MKEMFNLRYIFKIFYKLNKIIKLYFANVQLLTFNVQIY